jgi:hypothetical protein
VTTTYRAVVGRRMRLTTAFNRILQLPGASVRTVAFTDQGIVSAYAAGDAGSSAPAVRPHQGPEM